MNTARKATTAQLRREEEEVEEAVAPIDAGGDEKENDLTKTATRKRQLPRVLREQDVVGPRGVWSLYETVLAADLQFEKGKEAR
jgi:hypothetical protein